MMKQFRSQITSALVWSLCVTGVAHAAGHQVATKIAEFNEEKEISSMNFSSDTHRLATVEWTGAEIHIWKWEGEPVIEKRFRFTEGAAMFTQEGGLQYSPDDRLLAMVQTARRDDPALVKIWDTNAGSNHAIQEVGRRGLKSGVAFSPDGKFLIRSYDASMPSSASDDQLFVYDTKTWNLAWSLSTAPFVPKVMSLSSNGQLVALGGMTHQAKSTSPDVLIVDLQSHKVIRQWSVFAPDRTPSLLLWSPDNSRILALAVDGTETSPVPSFIELDPSSGIKTGLESNVAVGVQSLVFAAHGKYLIEGGEHLPVTIWNSAHTVKLQEIPIQPARLAVSKDGRYLAVVRLTKISVWQLD